MRTPARPNSIALFVPAEITSYCFYNGEEANRMVSNVIFSSTSIDQFHLTALLLKIDTGPKWAALQSWSATVGCFFSFHFRMGGAAIMLSNRADMAARAHYKLEHAARVHTASDDGAYACMSWGPDKAQRTGERSCASKGTFFFLHMYPSRIS
eukprot:1146966-Pelagomonas_calceolata.AAC.7